MTTIDTKVEQLRRQGVEIPAPYSIEIGEDVDLTQIRGPNTVLHSGTKLYGKELLIMPGCRIGYEEPATIEDCAVGPGCRLAGGFFSGATFLDDVVVGKGGHIRGGTLMEEQSNGAHTVGLKQTVLLPFVTLGSLINFCDVLMAGGTSRRDHSEVGSSYIHFNFTPFGRNGDKATPSLIGDIPRGVMLRSSRIFLGGQGGLVGPVHMDYGTVLAAGFVYRRDHGPNELVVGEKLGARTLPFTPLRYGRIRDKVAKNLTYIGNLVALWHWYDRVRLAEADADHTVLYGRAKDCLTSGVKERVKRLGQIAGYMEDSIGELQADATPNKTEIAAQRSFAESWPALEARLADFQTTVGDQQLFQRFDEGLRTAGGGAYLEQIQGLADETVEVGTAWLQTIVVEIEGVGDLVTA